MWWQFVGDTLPEMVFASAWTLLVTFFVQLVGIATGTGTNTSPGLVICMTVSASQVSTTSPLSQSHMFCNNIPFVDMLQAYAVYVILITTQLFNRIASVLLYALMCCIYATLFGVVVYFCPRLLTLMRPNLVNHRGLAVRLFVVTAACIFVFAAHAVNYARLVVAPPRKVYWWWQYGEYFFTQMS